MRKSSPGALWRRSATYKAQLSAVVVRLLFFAGTLNIAACGRDIRGRDDVTALASAKLPATTTVFGHRQVEPSMSSAEIAGLSDRSPLATDCRGTIATVRDDSILSVFSVGRGGIHRRTDHVIPRMQANQRPVVLRIFLRGDSTFVFDAATQRLIAFVGALRAPSVSQDLHPYPGRSIYDLVPGKGDTLFVISALPITAKYAYVTADRDIVVAMTRNGRIVRDSMLVTRARRFLAVESQTGVAVEADPFDRRLFFASDTAGRLYYAWAEIRAIGMFDGLWSQPKIFAIAGTELREVTRADIDVLADRDSRAGEDLGSLRAHILTTAPQAWPYLTALFVGSDGALWIGRGGPAWNPVEYNVIEHTPASNFDFSASPGTRIRAACGDTAYALVGSERHRRIVVLTASQQHAVAIRPLPSSP
jgi:hypothetical protein